MKEKNVLEEMRDAIDDFYNQRKSFLDQPKELKENRKDQEILISHIKDACVQDIRKILELSQKFDIIKNSHKSKLDEAATSLQYNQQIGLHTAFFTLSGIHKRIGRLLKSNIEIPVAKKKDMISDDTVVSEIIIKKTQNTYKIPDIEQFTNTMSRVAKRREFRGRLDHVFTPAKEIDTFESLSHTASVYMLAGGKDNLEKARALYRTIIISFPEDPNIEDARLALTDIRKQLQMINKIFREFSSEHKKSTPIKSTPVEKINLSETIIDPTSGTIIGSR